MADENENQSRELNEQVKIQIALLDKQNKALKKQLGIQDDLIETTTDLDQHFRKVVGTQLGVVVSGFAKNLKDAGLNAMRSGDAISTAGEFMSAQIGTLGTSFSTGAQGIATYGKELAAQGKKSGIVYAAAGEAVGALSGAVAQLTQAGISFMMTQTKNLIQGFQQMSAVGAIYTGGMKEMTDTALSGGMTLEQFSKAVTENRDKLNSLGLGMAEGSKRLADSMKAGGDEAKKAMFGLGMTMEEQAGAFATVMQRMAGPNQRLTSSNAEVAAQTMKYVENLKVLQELTGEDIKSKQETIRQENDNLAFQQKRAAMDPKARAELDAAMENMTESQRRALRENMIYGTVISKDIAIAEATNNGIRNANQSFYQAVQDGSISAEKAREIQGKNADDTAKFARENTSLALGTSDEARSAAKLNLENWQYSAKFSDEAREVAEKNTKEAAEAGRKGKAGTGGDLMKIQQDFSVQMQEIASKNLPEFSKAIKTTIDQIQGAVSVMAGGGAAAGSFMSGWTGIIVGALATVVPTIIGGILKSRAAGGVVSTAAGALGGAGGGVGGALGGIGQGAGAGVGGFMKGLAAGARALGNPQAILGLGAFTLAMMGLGKALEMAAPGIKAIGEGVATIIKGVAESLVIMSKDVDPLNLIKIAPGILAVGVALVPFGMGGALAGLVAGTGGLKAIVEDLKGFESLDPDRLNAVGDSIGKITKNLPSAAELAKLAIIGAMDKAGMLPGAPASSAPANATAGGSGPMGMEQLVALSKEQLSNQKEMLTYLRENAEVSRKIHTALI